MQAVGNFDEDNAYVITHGQQKLLKRFSLKWSPVTKDATGNFGKSFYDIGHFGTEKITDILVGIIRIFFNIMQ